MATHGLVSVRFEKTETPARFAPMPSKKRANRMLHVTFGTHKKHKASVPKHPNASMSRAHDAKQKTRRKNASRCFRNPLKTSKNKAKPKKKVLGKRMRKSRAPAGFVPKPLLGALPLSEGSADMYIYIS